MLQDKSYQEMDQGEYLNVFRAKRLMIRCISQILELWIWQFDIRCAMDEGRKFWSRAYSMCILACYVTFVPIPCWYIKLKKRCKILRWNVYHQQPIYFCNKGPGFSDVRLCFIVDFSQLYGGLVVFLLFFGKFWSVKFIETRFQWKQRAQT